ncbi:hypothetical protein BH11PLA1_BH11PLA1_09180 [soil metagenome]
MPPGESATKSDDDGAPGAGGAAPVSGAGAPTPVPPTAPTEGVLTATARQALRAIHQLSREREATHSAAQRRHDAAVTRASTELSAHMSSALQTLEKALAEVRATGDTAVASARQSGDEAISAAKRKFESEKSVLRERGEADVNSARKKMTEAVWMAETLHDTNIDKPGAALAKIRAEVERRQGELENATQRVEQELALLIRPGRAHPRPWGEGVAPAEPIGADAPKKDLAERFNREAEEVMQRAGRILTLRLPRMVVSPLPVVYGVIAGGATGIGVAALRNMQIDALTAGAGAAALLGVSVVGEVVRRGQKRRVIELGRNFESAALSVRETARALLKRAEEDRRSEEEAIRLKREREIERARKSADDVLNGVNEMYLQRKTLMETKVKEQVVELGQKRDETVAAAEKTRRAELARIDAAFRAANAEGKAKHDALRAEAEHASDSARAEVLAAWTSGMAAAHAALARVRTAGQRVDWRERSAAEIDWPVLGDVPAAVPLGAIEVDLGKIEHAIPTDARLRVPGDTLLHVPTLLELPDRASLLLQVGGGAAGINEARSAGLAALRAAMLRIMLTFPPGKVRFTIMDPVGLGQNFSAFMHLADFDPQLVSDRIWTEPRHIEARLSDLTEHMETVIQKYLRNEFASIEEYNRRAGEVAEPYRFLVVADFPAGFNEASAKRLASIIGSGPKCGVYTLIMHDTRQQLPQGITAADLKKAAVRLAWRRPAPEAPGRFVVDDADFGMWPLTLDAPPGDERFNDLVKMAGRRAKDAGRVQVPFATIAPPEDRLWTRTAAEDVSVALGRAGATRLQAMTLGRGTAQHMLIAGRTGSGKSTLLHVMITNLALWYSPDEVELYLVDFKKGVEFKAYSGTDGTPQLPHARVIAIESEREFGLSVLRKLDVELKRRGDLMREAGVQDLRGYRLTAGAQVMPRALLIVDEFQELFVEDDKLAQESGLLLDRLVRQGRAFGMHVVLGSQTLGGAYSLARATMGQMGVRIALQCSEADSYLILSEDNAAARLLSRPGEAIYNDASGAVEGNSLFQISWLEDTQRDAALRRISGAMTGEMRRRLPPAIVFEGNVPARVERTHALEQLLAGRVRPPANAAGQPTRVQVYLGDPVAIKDATAALLRRQSAANVLIVGQQEEAALAMLSVATIGIAAQHAAATVSGVTGPAAKMLLLDGTAADAETAGYLASVASAIPASVEARVAAYRDVGAAIEEIGAEVARRLEGEIGDAPAIYVVVHGLQRFRMLRRAEDEFDFSAASDGAAKPDKAFMKILKDGPAVGVHTLMWCDTATTLQRMLERGAAREFDWRVLFQMSAADAAALVDTPGAGIGMIGQNRAIIASEEQGTVEKFRPYALPTQTWLESARERMAGLGKR